MTPQARRLSATAAAVALVLLLSSCCVAPAEAGRALLMEELLGSSVHGALRSLQSVQSMSSTTCGTYRPSFEGDTSDPAPSGAVTYTQLQGLGWDLPPTYANFTPTDASALDWYSVMCNSMQATVLSNGTNCDYTKQNAEGPLGAVHVRYNCTERSFWVLAYLYSNYTLDTAEPGKNFWAQYDCATGSCDGNGELGGGKFIAYGNDTATSATLAAGEDCPSQGCSTPNTCSCHSNMWPVLSSDGGAWIGYLAKAYFSIASGFNITRSGFLPHLQWLGPDSKTAASDRGDGGGVCFECSGGSTGPSPPDPRPSCSVPTMSNTPPVDRTVCSDAASVDLQFVIKSDTPTNASDTTTLVNLTASAPDGVNCTINGAASPASVTVTTVNTDINVTVSCTNNTGTSWPASVPVTLTATQKARSDCDLTTSAKTTTVTLAPRPRVDASLDPLTPPSVCSDAAWKTFNFTVTNTGSLDNITITSITPPADCAAITDILSPVASGSTVTVNCTSAAWASGNFTLNVTTAAGSTGCIESFTRSVEVTRITPPVVKVVGTPSVVTVCARPGSTALTYTVFSSTGSSAVSFTASGGVTCTADKFPLTGVADNTTITLTCTNTTSGFPANFEVTVTATATDAYGCSGTESNTTTVTAPCCGSGTAMATSRDTTNSTSVCFRSLAMCGSSNWGFFNKLLVNESIADYTMVVGAGQGLCTNGANVGSVRVGCTNDVDGKAQFTIALASQTFLGAVNPSLWVGCRAAPPGCTPPRYGETKNTNFSTASISCSSTGCGGPFPSLLTAPTIISLACPCASVSFVIHESSSAFVAADSLRVRAANNGTCPAPSNIGKVGV